VCAGNPPTTPEGRWVIKFWAPWLDSQYPNPAKPGELRWFTTVNGEDKEMPNGDPVLIDGQLVKPLSRTFIPSAVTDNPFLLETGYMAMLQALPEPLRSQMLHGDFSAGIEDSAWQVLPTSWVEAAMARWTPEGGVGKQMTSVGADVARGGTDKTVVALRYENWYDNLKRWPGKDTPDGATAAGVIISVVKDNAPIHVDGIGVGGSVYDHLKGINVHAVAVISSAMAKDAPQLDGEFDRATQQLKFKNMRSLIWWRFREKLDPKSGENICLPPDAQLKADLTAPHWKVTTQGIVIESKDDSLDARGNVVPGLVRRLGRSPDNGDAVVYAGIDTAKIVRTGQNFRKHLPRGSWKSA